MSGNAIHCRKKNLSGENENKDIEWENSHIVKAVNPHDNVMTIILEDGKWLSKDDNEYEIQKVENKIQSKQRGVILIAIILIKAGWLD